MAFVEDRLPGVVAVASAFRLIIEDFLQVNLFGTKVVLNHLRDVSVHHGEGLPCETILSGV